MTTIHLHTAASAASNDVHAKKVTEALADHTSDSIISIQHSHAVSEVRSQPCFSFSTLIVLR